MPEVKIYIETSLQGPCVKTGWYAAIVEYTTKKGIPVTREVIGMEETTTYYRSVLLAIVKALELLNKSCKVTIYTRCSFIIGLVQRGSIEAWKREEWRKSTGETVQNKELWQQFAEEMDRHQIAFRLSKHHGYREYLQLVIRKQIEKYEENAGQMAV